MAASQTANPRDRAHFKTLMLDVIADMRAAGRDPQTQQLRLGALLATRFGELAQQGVAWAARVRQVAWADLGIEAMLRRHGIEPE